MCPGGLLLRLAREAVGAGLVLRNIHPRNLLLVPPPPPVEEEAEGKGAMGHAGEGCREQQQQHQVEAGEGEGAGGDDGAWGLRMVDVGCDWTPAGDPRDTDR